MEMFVCAALTLNRTSSADAELRAKKVSTFEL